MSRENHSSVRQSTGQLIVDVFEGNRVRPIIGASVSITADIAQVASRQIPPVTAATDVSGLTTSVDLPAPDVVYSLQPSEIKPYAEYTVTIEAPGYVPVRIEGVQILATATAIQDVQMVPMAQADVRQEMEQIVIPDHTLYGIYPPKIPENALAIPDPPPTGSVVLDNPVVPEFIIVHDGAPDDPTAPRYSIPFKDYIKNVASSEIYSTWPIAAIRANVICILSFTLNRVFTEFYRGRGFTITSSTAHDHKFIRGRNIYQSISTVVDELFNQFIGIPGRRQPFLAQYCDGQQIQCPGWLTQWGSKFRADLGENYIQILEFFYGPQIEIRRAVQVQGVPESFPGYNLQLGASGAPVRKIQTFLNRIADNYPAIPKVRVDGVFGEATAEAVRTFQRIFFLPQNAIVDYPTWYRISDIYVAVERLAVGPVGGPRSIVPALIPYNRQPVYIPTLTWVPMWVPMVQYRKKYKKIIK